MRRAGRHVGSNLVAYTALFFALTGSAVAAKPLITGADIKDETIEAVDIAGGAVGSSEIANGSIIGPDLAAKAVGQGQISDGSIIGPEIADGAIGSKHVADDALTGADIDESTLTLGETMSLAALSGTPCTRSGGTPGELAISVGLNNVVTFVCGIGTDAAARLMTDGPSNGVFFENVACESDAIYPGTCSTSVEISNVGKVEDTGELTVELFAVDGFGETMWEIAADGCSGATLKPSTSCSIDLGFTPDTPGAAEYRLLVVSANPGGELGVLLVGGIA